MINWFEQVFSVDDLEKESTFIGEATLRLLPTPKLPSTTRLPLIGLPHTPQLGELLFSLSYSHTSEKLTIVVVKARNLQGANADPGDYYVKVLKTTFLNKFLNFFFEQFVFQIFVI